MVDLIGFLSGVLMALGAALGLALLVVAPGSQERRNRR